MIEVIESVLPYRRDRMRSIERALDQDARVLEYWIDDYTVRAQIDTVSRTEARRVLCLCVYGRPRVA